MARRPCPLPTSKGMSMTGPPGMVFSSGACSGAGLLTPVLWLSADPTCRTSNTVARTHTDASAKRGDSRPHVGASRLRETPSIVLAEYHNRKYRVRSAQGESQDDDGHDADGHGTEQRKAT